MGLSPRLPVDPSLLLTLTTLLYYLLLTPGPVNAFRGCRRLMHVGWRRCAVGAVCASSWGVGAAASFSTICLQSLPCALPTRQFKPGEALEIIFITPLLTHDLASCK